MWRQVLALVIKELLAVLKDGKSRMVLIGPPLIQLMVFSYAATFDLNHVPIAIYDEDNSLASRDLVARFIGSPTFAQVADLHSERRIKSLIDARQAAMALVIHPHFTRDLLRGQPASVQIIVDGRNSNTALLILGYADTIVSDFSLAWTASHGGPAPPAVLDLRAWYNPALLSRWFIVPGIVALLTQVVTLLVVGLSVAREREAGTFDQLLVTPLRQIDILLGKGLPGLLIGTVEASAIIFAAVWWFAIPLRGSLASLYLGLVLFCHRRHRHRPDDLLARGDPAAGAARRIPVHGAVDHSFGLRHADRQHAGGGAGPNLSQPNALFPDHRAQRIPRRGRPALAAAAVLADGADRGRHAVCRRMAFSQADRLRQGILLGGRPGGGRQDLICRVRISSKALCDAVERVNLQTQVQALALPN